MRVKYVSGGSELAPSGMRKITPLIMPATRIDGFQPGIAGDAYTSRPASAAVAFASLVATERACVWTLGGLLDTPQVDQLLRGADELLRPFAAADNGAVTFGMPALVITLDKS